MNVRMNVIIHGRVQGVSFRYYTRDRAVELGVTGWVRNLPDGSVQGLLEGDNSAVQALVEWCRCGPPAAQVDRVDVSIAEYSGEFDSFTIA